MVDGSGAAAVTLLNGGFGHAAGNTLTVNDAQLGGGGAANLTFNVATIGAADGIEADTAEIYNGEDYLFYDNPIAGNTSEKNSSIIVGPGQNLLVYSSSADLSYVVNGFETQSDDFEVKNMTKISF